MDNTLSLQHAQTLDAKDPLHPLRNQFLVPTKADLQRRTLSLHNNPNPDTQDENKPCNYLCGNSLGLQPRTTRKYIDAYLRTWATKGVTGHFVPHDDQLLPPFIDVDEVGARLMAPVVGARQDEVAVMGSLTGNVHLLLGSFYRPPAGPGRGGGKAEGRYKIIMEGKAFPSDHYAIESQLLFHGFDPSDAMILIEPENPNLPILPTDQIYRTIDAHASSAAILFLSAVQFYTGQYFEIQKITAYAQERGILVGWDCAHAAGNVDLKLHEWNVDFAAWCCYKYLNSGPGGMAAIFVHERHGRVDGAGERAFRPRLAGWWGDDKGSRFLMENKFTPQPGAAGYQLSNPSVLDMNAVVASLDIFSRTSMAAIREKSLALTGYLEKLLLNMNPDQDHHHQEKERPFTIITPSDPAHRGAQLSVRLKSGILDSVLEALQDHGIVVDERKPDVIRVAPAPLYNTYVEVWEFCTVFLRACMKVGGNL